MKNIAIVLAGGNGSRMNSNIPKQYMEIAGKTILHYSLQQFEECPFIDEIILVTRKEDVDYCKDTYRMSKISHIVEGGKERYESVMNGLDLVEDEGYVYIHDGARPCITEELLDRLYNDVKLHRATVLAVRSKDTVRISDDKGNAVITPNRDNVWLIQTPQVFDISLIKQAYYNLKKYGTGKNITPSYLLPMRAVWSIWSTAKLRLSWNRNLPAVFRPKGSGRMTALSLNENSAGSRNCPTSTP